MQAAHGIPAGLPLRALDLGLNLSEGLENSLLLLGNGAGSG